MVRNVSLQGAIAEEKTVHSSTIGYFKTMLTSNGYGIPPQLNQLTSANLFLSSAFLSFASLKNLAIFFRILNK